MRRLDECLGVSFPRLYCIFDIGMKINIFGCAEFMATNTARAISPTDFGRLKVAF